MDILVVEDSEDERDALVYSIKSSIQANVVIATSHAEAMSAIAAETFDLVFMDIVLPDHPSGGIEATAEIRRKSSSTVIVLMTGLDEADDLVQSVYPADRILHYQKPIGGEQIQMAAEISTAN
jgi:DNA-binding response OmpR family regulator